MLDGGPENKSQITKELFRLTGCEHRIIIPYNPTGSSVVERSHKTILGIIRKYAMSEPKLWPSLLPYATLAYNSSVNATTGYIPLQLLNNRPISRVVIGREFDYRSRLIYVRYCLTNTTLCL